MQRHAGHPPAATPGVDDLARGELALGLEPAAEDRLGLVAQATEPGSDGNE